MKWSWSLGRVAGIEVRVHATFLLLLGLIAWMSWAAGGTVQAAAGGLLFLAAVFGSVLAHEFGHALAARRYGIATRDITLLPIGGVARLERMPERPLQELWVAVAGPLVNVGIAAALGLGLHLAGVASGGLWQGGLVERLAWANLWLVGFNLVPAFPMDGGRVLRALLALRMDRVRATQLAARVGRAAAVLFGAAGLFVSPMLMVIAVFVWFGATQEAAQVEVQSALQGVRVGHAMTTDVRAVHPFDRLGSVAELWLSGAQRDFPVVVHGRLVGLLDRAALLDGLRERGPAGFVADAMTRDVPAVAPDEPLEAALARLASDGHPVLPVVHAGRLVGLLAADRVGDALQLQEALRAAAAAPPARRFAAVSEPWTEPVRP